MPIDRSIDPPPLGTAEDMNRLFTKQYANKFRPAAKMKITEVYCLAILSVRMLWTRRN